MELKNMEYFITIAQEGSITKAAQLLHMTQPNLSRQIMLLEDELGTKLLIRTNKKSELTEDGRQLLQRFHEILSLVHKTEQEFLGDTKNIQGTVSIGAVESVGLQMIGKQVFDFRQLYPDVKFDISTANGDDLKEKLLQGLLDFVVLTEPVDVASFDYLRLPFSEKWGVLVSCEHPLAAKDAIDISKLHTIPAYYPQRALLQQEIFSWLGISQEFHSLGTYAQLLGVISILKDDSKGAAAVCLEGASKLFSQDQLKFIPLSPSKESRSIMIWKKDRIFPPVIRLFHRAICNAF